MAAPCHGPDDGPAARGHRQLPAAQREKRQGFTGIPPPPPPLTMLRVSFAIEWWVLLTATMTLVKKLTGKSLEPTSLFEPSTVAAGLTADLDDAEARQVTGGGVGTGYKPACLTGEGMCAVIGESSADVMQKARAKAQTEAAKVP